MPVAARLRQEEESDPITVGRFPPLLGSHQSASAGHNFASIIFDVPNLSEVDERKHLHRYQTSLDPTERQQAMEALWLSFGKLVVSIASGYRSVFAEVGDLIGVGFLGLHWAISHFDLQRAHVRLATYAIPRIRYEMQTYIRGALRPVAPPESNGHRQLIRNARRLLEDARKACQRDGVAAELSELARRIAARVALTAHEVESTLQLLSNTHMSLSCANETQVAATGLATKSHENQVLFDLDCRRVKETIIALMGEILGQAERRVFEARCLAQDEPEKLAQIATRMGVSTERISQLEASAKRKIAIALAGKGIFNGDPETLVLATRTRALRKKSPLSHVEENEASFA